MSKIHVWIGNTEKSSDEFYNYFKINQADKDLGIGASQFDKDLGINWYNDDFIGTFYNEESTDLEVLLDEIPTSPDSLGKIEKICIDRKLDEVNAMFYYEDAELAVNDINKLYNGLQYIGCFDN
ncbi:immunity 22 family protein [Flavobacterium columnare]|uniref:immunity 22 family protein n=2 Tax=Flavobacteriaceae TaxID=49546 RepID=UPI004034461F